MKQLFIVSGVENRKALQAAAGSVKAMDGVISVRARFRARRMRVRFHPDRITAREIVARLEENGVHARAYVNPAGPRFLIRLWTSLLLCLITMYLSLATAWHLPLPRVFSYPLSAGITQLILMIPVWLLCADVIKSRKFEARHRTPGLFRLALLGCLTSAIYSLPALVVSAYHISAGHAYKPEFYFDCAALIPAMIYLGQALEFSAHRRNEAAFIKYVGALPDEDVRLSSTRSMRKVTLLSNISMPVILALAVGTAVYWYLTGETLGFSVHTAVCVLVISCPCAPGLAVPAVMMNGMTRAAQRGVPMRSAPTLEKLGKTDTVIAADFHLSTRSHARVQGCVLTPGTSFHQLLSLAASAVQLSSSACARAILDAAGAEKLPLDPLSDYDETNDGVRALIGETRLLVGNFDFLSKNAMDMTGWTEKNDMLADEGCTSIYLAVSGRILGILSLKEELDAEVITALSDLKSMNIEAHLLTPARPRAAEVAMLKAGFASIIHPEDAEMTLRLMKADKKRILGLYDTAECPDLFAGFPLTMAKADADVTPENPDLTHVVTAIKTARASLRLLRRDLLTWLIFDLIGIPIAAGILYRPLGFALSPMLATPLMLKVCTLMLTNHIKKDKPQKTKTEETNHA